MEGSERSRGGQMQDDARKRRTRNARLAALKAAVRDGSYVIDPDAIATAIIARALVQGVLPRTRGDN